MSNDGEQKPELKESEKILEQIEAMKKGTPTSSKPAEDQVKADVPSTPEKVEPQPTAQTEPAPKGQAEETKAPTDKKEGKPEVDIREWAKKKGIKEGDTESILKNYRELERKLSQLNSERNKTEDIRLGPVTQFPPQHTPWQPTPQMAPWQPSQPYFQPSPQDREAIIQQEADRFNIPVEDFKRILPMVNEVSEIKLNRRLQELQSRYDSQLAELARGNKRSSEFNELMTDPLFTSPEVAFEIDQIFNENPLRLKLEPTPYTSAFKEALERIARKKLQGEVSGEVTPLPSSPPKEGGKGSVSSVPVVETPQSIVDRFKKMSVEDMKKQLTSIGAIPPDH